MAPIRNLPRLVVAATGSGVGKTTVTVALIAALQARGLRVAAFKCGPDYLDPTYHARMTGRPSQNLDSWMMGRDAVAATVAHAAAHADIAVVEGMMGLFDGTSPTSDEGSTAELAKWIDAPVVLVLDASGIARTVCAVAAGFAHYDPRLHVAGLICNRVGGFGHLSLLRQAKPVLPIFGGLPDERDLRFPERHLGLLSASQAEIGDQVFAGWRALAEEWFDLDAILEAAECAPPIALPPSSAGTELSPKRCTIAIAYDEAFHFYYDENLNLLEQAGAEIVRFSPCRDALPPAADGYYFGGGYPEAHAQALAENASMLAALRECAAAGTPIYAECGGLMYLCQAIRTRDGRDWPMAQLLPGVAVMQPRLQALGYVEVETLEETLLGPPGLRFRGHQFRYSTLTDGDNRSGVAPAYRVSPRFGASAYDEGYRAGSVLGTYVHAHWASNPRAPRAFVSACEQFRANRSRRSESARSTTIQD